MYEATDAIKPMNAPLGKLAEVQMMNCQKRHSQCSRGVRKSFSSIPIERCDDKEATERLCEAKQYNRRLAGHLR